MFSLSRIPFERDIGLLLMQDSIVHCLGFIIEKVSDAFIFAKNCYAILQQFNASCASCNWMVERYNTC